MNQLKNQQNQFKNNAFFQKFNGKVNKVSRLGINAVLLKQEFEDFSSLKSEIKKQKLQSQHQKQTIPQLFKTRTPQIFNTPQRKPKIQQDESSNIEKSKSLRRHPSQRLPIIHNSSQLLRESSYNIQIREKMKSEQNRKEIRKQSGQSGSKYRSWKYPPRLSEQALRFFAFADGEMRLGIKSTKN